MRYPLITRTLLGAGLVLGLVASSAAPAAAAATHLDFVLDSSGNPSTMTLPWAGYPAISLEMPDPGTPQACDVPDAPSFLTPDIDASGNVALATTDYKHAVGTSVTPTLAPTTWTVGGTDYQVVVEGHHATTGTISGTTATIDVDVSVVVRPCGGGGAPLCTINHVVATLSGTFTGSLPPADGDTIMALLGVSAPLTASNFAIGCNSSIRAGFLGQAATFDFHLVNDLSPLPH